MIILTIHFGRLDSESLLLKLVLELTKHFKYIIYEKNSIHFSPDGRANPCRLW